MDRHAAEAPAVCGPERRRRRRRSARVAGKSLGGFDHLDRHAAEAPAVCGPERRRRRRRSARVAGKSRRLGNASGRPPQLLMHGPKKL